MHTLSPPPLPTYPSLAINAKNNPIISNLVLKNYATNFVLIHLKIYLFFFLNLGSFEFFWVNRRVRSWLYDLVTVNFRDFLKADECFDNNFFRLHDCINIFLSCSLVLMMKTKIFFHQEEGLYKNKQRISHRSAFVESTLRGWF